MSRSVCAVYHCDVCKTWATQWLKYDAIPAACPGCGGPVHRYTACVRSPEYYSDALGVAPNQVEEAKRQFPHHEFAPDGRMRIRNPQHRKQVLRELGYADYK